MNDGFADACGTTALALVTSSGAKYEQSKYRADDSERDSPPADTALAIGHDLPSTRLRFVCERHRPRRPWQAAPSSAQGRRSSNGSATEATVDEEAPDHDHRRFQQVACHATVLAFRRAPRSRSHARPRLSLAPVSGTRWKGSSRAFRRRGTRVSEPHLRCLVAEYVRV
jgi:hypothetical protein